MVNVAILQPVGGEFSHGTNSLNKVAGNTGKSGSAGSIAGVAAGGSGDLFWGWHEIGIVLGKELLSPF